MAEYHLLCSIDYINNHDIWNRIWWLQVQERVKFFIWIVLRERLMTNFQKSPCVCALWNWSGNIFTCTKGLSHCHGFMDWFSTIGS